MGKAILEAHKRAQGVAPGVTGDVPCARYAPGLWVDDHATERCPDLCWHEIGKHLCLEHCPAMVQCFLAAQGAPQQWDGMVVGGDYWVRLGKQRYPRPHASHQPPQPQWCPECEMT